MLPMSLSAMAVTLLCIMHTGPMSVHAAEITTPPPSPISCGPSSRYIVGYYQTWKRQSLMNIDWPKITHLNVAHAVPTDSGDFTFDGEWFLPTLVRDAHKQQTKISLSIGGWTGSNRLSTIMRDTHKRATMIRAIGTFVEKHELDGVDIDWEYVGRQGSKCNKFSAEEDAGNFMRFLRALRASFHARFPDTEKLVSLAVRVQPFDDTEGPMKDVSPFAEYVDFASIMAFDINGPWSNTTGPNAPLEHQHNRGMQLSYTQAVDQWLAAKWPAEKLIAGVSFHGRSLTTRNIITAKEGAEMYVPFDKDVPQGDAEDSFWYDVCENVNSMSGVWQYKHLRDQGILKTTNTTGDEWVRVWDDKSSTPWLYNPPMRRFISYDDQASIDRKVEYAKKKNLKGMMAWSLHSDYNAELISALDNIGPLCRGPKTESDNVTVTTTSASSTSVWTPTAPFANLPTLPPSTSASSTLSATSVSKSELKSESLSSTGNSTLLSASDSASPSASNTSTEALASSASSSSSGKLITFNDVGAPILVINGVSTPIPSDLAEKIMKMAEKTTSASTLSANATDTATSASGPTTGLSESPSADATASTNDNSSALTSQTDDALPLGPIAIPIVDSADKARISRLQSTYGPSRPAWNVATNLFDSPLTTSKTTAAIHDIFLGLLTTTSTPIDLLVTSTEATPAGGGFAATFFLSLDTSSQSGGLKTTTVVPLSQLIASAKSEAALGLSRATTQGSLDPLPPLASSSVVLSSSESVSVSDLLSASTTAMSTTESLAFASGSITL